MSSNTTKLFIGIDPGKGGAIAALRFRSSNKGYMISAATIVLSKSNGELGKWMGNILDSSGINTGSGNVYAMLERVGGYIGKGEDEKGGGRANASKMFVFGESSGACKMLMACFGIPYELATARTWQAKVGMTGGKKKGETQSAWKNRLKARAMQLYPPLGKVTLAVADALLIAHYCRMTRAGMLE